jgi:hypothetical protein
MTEQAKVAVTAADLKDILTAVVVEARKPVVTEKELREEQDRLDMARSNAASVKQLMENKARLQAACSHLRRDGSSRCVYVRGSGNDPDASNYLLCQYCQKFIFSNETELFNKHLQMTAAGDIVA